MSEIIKCDHCGESFSNEISDTIEFWEIENKFICWNCKNELGLTDCCDCGAEIYAIDNEFDLWMCEECLKKWRAKQ
jgi:hypothetical protein